MTVRFHLRGLLPIRQASQCGHRNHAPLHLGIARLPRCEGPPLVFTVLAKGVVLPGVPRLPGQPPQGRESREGS